MWHCTNCGYKSDVEKLACPDCNKFGTFKKDKEASVVNKTSTTTTTVTTTTTSWIGQLAGTKSSVPLSPQPRSGTAGHRKGVSQNLGNQGPNQQHRNGQTVEKPTTPPTTTSTTNT